MLVLSSSPHAHPLNTSHQVLAFPKIIAQAATSMSPSQPPAQTVKPVLPASPPQCLKQGGSRGLGMGHRQQSCIRGKRLYKNAAQLWSASPPRVRCPPSERMSTPHPSQPGVGSSSSCWVQNTASSSPGMQRAPELIS